MFDQQILALFITVALACAVEMVEAATIVLAMGAVRGWRSSLWATATALATLGAVIIAFGPAILLVPIETLRLVVGVLLLIFGLQWLRKAVQRASGYKALHDEEKIYQAEVEASKRAGNTRTLANLDAYAFTLTFKTVLLEGFEVVFIVLTFGVLKDSLDVAIWASLTSLLLVAGAAFAVRKPLARVPENTMKFVVGAMASTFGIFWATEGIGAVWPQSDLVLLPLFAWVMLISLGSVLWLRQRITKHPLSSLPKPIKSSKDKGVLVRGIKVVISFILDFVVGDEYITAIAIWTVVAFSLVVHESNDASNWLTFAALFGLLLPLGTAFQVRRLS